MIRRFILAILMPLTLALWAQSTDSADSTNAKQNKPNLLIIDASVLAHAETRNGGLPLAKSENDEMLAVPTSEKSKSANFLSGKTRLIIDYQRKPVEVKLIMQNSAVWGQESNTQLGLYEAWAKVNTPFGLFVQAGRQALSYDDERILGPNDWAMESKSHDALRIGYEGHNHKVHAIFALNQNADNVNGGSFYADGAQPYKSMQTLWYHYDAPKFPFSASLMFMNTGMQAGKKGEDEHTEYQQLLGTYLTYQPDQWGIEGSAYHQFGKNEYGIKINAWLFALKGLYKPTEQWAITLGYDYLSGDRYFAIPPKGEMGLILHKEIKGFNTVYGSHHKFYGAMDFFYVSTYVNGFTPGLQNAYVGAGYKPIDKLKLGAEFHYLATAANLHNLKPTLGYELELAASYKFSDMLTLSAGFSYMRGTETMERLKRTDGDRRLCWGWISFTVAPRFLFHRW